MTREEKEVLLRDNITEAGGYTREFLKSIGVPWPPKKGWKKRFLEDSAHA